MQVGGKKCRRMVQLHGAGERGKNARQEYHLFSAKEPTRHVRCLKFYRAESFIARVDIIRENSVKTVKSLLGKSTKPHHG